MLPHAILTMSVNKKHNDAQWQEGSQYLWHSPNYMKCVEKKTKRRTMAGGTAVPVARAMPYEMRQEK